MELSVHFRQLSPRNRPENLAGNPFLRQNIQTVKILALSDEVVERLYSLCEVGHFSDIELILGCGDLPYPYLENLVTFLNVPLYYVPGNHDPRFNPQDIKSYAEGGSNLDLRIVRVKTFLIGGLGGSILYRPDGTNQYTQTDAYLRAFRLLPRLLLNRINYGRALDILITHSPPFGIHDDDTEAHRGLKAVNWLIQFARPRYHFHGHTHFYRRNLSASESNYRSTKVINVHPYKIIDVYH
ncbi:MAG: metallophosphoesterase [Anaerolineales bacterium]|nr:MAG: metallophosphoesterase [Anaerolineales bacterium]